MKILNLTGIVLREVHYGENNNFLLLFTKELGIVKVAARGVRKLLSSNAAATQVFAYSKFSVNASKNRLYLDSSSIIHNFYYIRDDINKLALANYTAQIIEAVAGHYQQKNDLIRLFLNTLYFIESGKRNLILIKAVFELRLMTEIGLMPDIVCCNNCMKYISDFMCFDIIESKLYCNSCSKNFNDGTTVIAPASVIHAMRHIVFADFDRLFNFRLSDPNLKKLSEITEKFLL